jgi:hypothetical protein
VVDAITKAVALLGRSGEAPAADRGWSADDAF